MFAAAIDDARLLACETGHALLQRAVLFVNSPDTREAFVTLRNTIDQIVIALIGRWHERVDDISVRQAGRSPGGARWKQAALFGLLDFGRREWALGPILISERCR